MKYYLKIIKYLSFLRVLVRLCINSRKSKYLFFFSSYHTGGAEQVHLDIINSVKGHNSILFFFNESLNNHFLEAFKRQNYVVNIYRYKDNKFLMRLFILYLKKIRNKTFFGSCNYEYYDLLPYIHESNLRIDLLHNITYPNKWVDYYSLKYVKYIDKRIIIYNKIKDFFIKEYDRKNIDKSYLNRFITIYNGVEIGRLYPKDFKENRLKVIFCGRIEENKRVNLIIKAINKITRDKINFKIYGYKHFEDADINKYFIKNIKDFREMNFVYDESHILIMASKIEGTPKVIMEAMARGVVCISTDAGGIPEILNEKTGILINNSLDEQEIIDSIYTSIEYLCNNRNILEEKSKLAYQYAKDYFNIELFTNRYQKELENNGK